MEIGTFESIDGKQSSAILLLYELLDNARKNSSSSLFYKKRHRKALKKIIEDIEYEAWKKNNTANIERYLREVGYYELQNEVNKKTYINTYHNDYMWNSFEEDIKYITQQMV